MPDPQIEIEADPTPLVMALRADLERRLAEPEFAALTGSVRGTAALVVGGGPEAATIELGESIRLRHGASEVDVTATLDTRGQLDGVPIDGEEEHGELARWLRDLASRRDGSWRDAAARFWAELEASPGAPQALLVADLESGESERFGDGERAYEIHGRPADLLALLEGRSSLLEEAFERRIYIRGSFSEISVLFGAGLRARLSARATDA